MASDCGIRRKIDSLGRGRGFWQLVRIMSILVTGIVGYYKLHWHISMITYLQ